VFPPRLVLLDRLVHHQDIRRALDHTRAIPTDRLRRVLQVAPTAGSVIRGKQRSRGLRLEATDVDFHHGSSDAPVVRGPGEALVMAILGRGHAVNDLDGDGLPTLRTRLA
jgi:hypothetical protein